MTVEDPGTILTPDDEEFLLELSEYLEILGNSTRLRILRLLEKRALDARSISVEIETSYENTKKHLERLLHAGLLTRRPGLGKETSRGTHPAWEYAPVPGVLQRIQRDLGVFSAFPSRFQGSSLQERVSDVRSRFSRECGPLTDNLVVVGGEWDGRVIPLSSPCMALGRAMGNENPDIAGCEPVAFPASYRSLTRISRPHALIMKRGDHVLIEDRGSTGGTYLNEKRIPDHQPARLRDGDRITLSQGEFGVTLVFIGMSGQDNERGRPGG